MGRAELICGLDIGTSKVLAAVAEIVDHKVNVIGIGRHPSGGIRRGAVVDIDSAAGAVREAMEAARRMAGVDIGSVYVSVGGEHLALERNRGVVAVPGEFSEITPEEVRRVMEAARVVSLPPEKQIIHVLPRQFIVDGYEGVQDPVGMAGMRLEVEANIISGSTTALKNLSKVVESAGYRINAIVASPLAASQAVLNNDEKELGAVVLDIGGGTTGIAVYQEGSLSAMKVLPVGGDHITNDIAVGLRTPVSQAESLKKTHGTALTDESSDGDYFEIPSVGGQERRQVSHRFLASIIGPRMEELLYLCYDTVRSWGYEDRIPGGVILSGGGGLQTGALELAAGIFNAPARRGAPNGVVGLSDSLAGPAETVAVGLLLYASRNRGKAFSRKPAGTAWEVFGKVRSWFGEFF